MVAVTNATAAIVDASWQRGCPGEYKVDGKNDTVNLDLGLCANAISVPRLRLHKPPLKGVLRKLPLRCR